MKSFSELWKPIGKVIEREATRVRLCLKCKNAYTWSQAFPANIQLFQQYHGDSPIELAETFIYCSDCYLLVALERQLERQSTAQAELHVREHRRVLVHFDRAVQAGVPATLTIREWIEILDRYDWKCAYCGEPYEVLEHFIPIALGGGTTKENCLPACNFCNGLKSSRSPEQIIRSARGIQRIAQEVAKQSGTTLQISSNSVN